VLLLVFVVGPLVYWRYGYDIGRWGCPTDEELQRPRTPDEVEDAFDGEGLALERIAWPAELRRARSYEGATVLRHETPGVTLTLVVCRSRCEVSRFQIRPGRPREQVRFGFSTANLAGWIAGSDRQADRDLRDPLSRAIDGLGTSVDPGSRCYIG
jgi:hypothetical protein